MENVELKQCPFCGDIPELFEDEPKEFYVACTNPDCKVEAYFPFAKTRSEAIKHWNERRV